MSAFRRRLMFPKIDVFDIDNNSFQLSTNTSTALTVNLISSRDWTITNNYPNIACNPMSGNGGSFAINVGVTYETESDGIYSFSVSNGKTTKDVYIVYIDNFNLHYTEITYSPTLDNGTPLVPLPTTSGTTTQSIIVYINGEYTTGILEKKRSSNHGSCDMFLGYTYTITITSPKFSYSYLKTNDILKENTYSSSYEITDSNGEITRDLFRLYEPI